MSDLLTPYKFRDGDRRMNTKGHMDMVSNTVYGKNFRF